MNITSIKNKGSDYYENRIHYAISILSVIDPSHFAKLNESLKLYIIQLLSNLSHLNCELRMIIGENAKLFSSEYVDEGMNNKTDYIKSHISTTDLESFKDIANEVVSSLTQVLGKISIDYNTSVSNMNIFDKNQDTIDKSLNFTKDELKSANAFSYINGKIVLSDILFIIDNHSIELSAIDNNEKSASNTFIDNIENNITVVIKNINDNIDFINKLEAIYDSLYIAQIIWFNYCNLNKQTLKGLISDNYISIRNLISTVL